MSRNSDPVILKPLLGISPKAYVFFIFLLIVFLFLYIISWFSFYKAGATITISPMDSDSMVFINDQYKGSTPLTIDLDYGSHKIVLKKDFFEDHIQEITLYQIPFTRSLYRKYLNPKLNLIDQQSLLNFTKKELFKWSIIKEYTANYKYPNLFYNLSKDVEKDVFIDFVSKNLALVSSKEILNDLISALKNKDDTLELDNAEYIFEYFNKLSAFKLTQKWYDNLFKENYSSKNETTINYDGTVVEDDNYWYISNKDNYTNSYTQEEVNFNLNIKISKKSITIDDFKKFIEENPEFNLESKQKLIKSETVDILYLSQNILLEDGDNPIKYINYNILEEFVKWYSMKNNSKFIVPTDDMLYYLSALNKLPQNTWIYSSSYAWTNNETTTYNNPTKEDGAILIKIFKNNKISYIPNNWTLLDAQILIAEILD